MRRGANCQLLVDDCGTGLFCTNGGTCQNLNNVQSGAICICPTGAGCASCNCATITIVRHQTTAHLACSCWPSPMSAVLLSRNPDPISDVQVSWASAAKSMLPP